MWDIRYHTNKPMQIFDIPQKPNRIKSGKIFQNIIENEDLK